MIKSIFGKNIKITSSESFKESVKETVKLYQDVVSDGNYHISVDIRDISEKPKKKSLARNPSLHHINENGFTSIFPLIDVDWSFDKSVIEVKGYLKIPTGVKAKVNKIRSMEFSSIDDIVEQVIHELILVPSLFFLTDRMPIHAAAISVDDQAVLLAGTGGVGKSSAMLSVKDNPRVKFISDDISVIDKEGNVYLNSAWPKVYGYNCVGNDLIDHILKGKNVFNKAHFYLKNKVNNTKVRRKIKPDLLFDSGVVQKSKTSKLIYLFKENVDEISLSYLDVDEAFEMTYLVMVAEYSNFIRNIHWDQYNRISRNMPILFSTDDIKEYWRNVFFSAFSNLKICKVSIPLSIEHKKYQCEIEKILTNEN